MDDPEVEAEVEPAAVEEEESEVEPRVAEVVEGPEDGGRPARRRLRRTGLVSVADDCRAEADRLVMEDSISASAQRAGTVCVGECLWFGQW